MDVATLRIAIQTGDIKKAEKELDKLESAAKSAEKASDSLGIGYAAAGTAIVASLGAIGRAAVNSAAEAEQASAKMIAVLNATGYAAGLTKKDLDDLADSMAGSTLFDDESIRNASSVLLTFRNVQGDTFREGIKLAADLSAILGGDLNSATLQIGKALQDPVQGITALSRVGVQFSEVQKDQIKNFVETNQLAKAQEIVLGELRSQVGGASEAINSGLNKSLADAKKSWDELTESIGKGSEIQKGVPLVLGAVSSAFQKLTEDINETGSAFSGFVKFVFRPVDLNLLNFDDGKRQAKEYSDELERIQKRFAALGAEKQKQVQSDDAEYIAKKKIAEENKKLLEQEKKRTEQLKAEGIKGWVDYADAVFKEADELNKELAKIAEDRNKEEERLRQEDLKGWVRYAEEIVNQDFREAEQLAKDQVKAVEDQKKADKDRANEMRRDLSTAIQRAFESGKDPAQAFVQGFASTLFARMSASLYDALATAALEKLGMGGNGLSGAIDSGISAIGSWLGNLSFDGGGSTGSGSRSGGLDGKGGFMAMLHPNETVIDHTKGQGMGQIVYSPVIQIDSRTDKAEVQRLVNQAVQNGNAQLVDRLTRQGKI